MIILDYLWKVKSLSRVQLCYPVEYSPPGSSVHGIFQARILEWVAISFSRGSSYEPPGKPWIIWVGTKCNQKNPYKTERKANFTYKEKTVWRWRQILEWCCHKLRNAGTHQNLGKARTRFSLPALRGVLLWCTLILIQWCWSWTSGIQNCDRISFCCF